MTPFEQALFLVLNYQNRSRIIELEQTIRNLEHNDAS